MTRADGTALKSGEAYVPGEVLKIGLPVKAQGVFETVGGDFVGGMCGARRMLPNKDGFACKSSPTHPPIKVQQQLIQTACFSFNPTLHPPTYLPHTAFTAPKDGLDVTVWAGYAAKHGAVTLTQGFVLKGK